MKKVTVNANTEIEAIELCKTLHGWTPDAIREVDSGNDDGAWMCFESIADAIVWDNQK